MKRTFWINTLIEQDLETGEAKVIKSFTVEAKESQAEKVKIKKGVMPKQKLLPGEVGF